MVAQPPLLFTARTVLPYTHGFPQLTRLESPPRWLRGIEVHGHIYGQRFLVSLPLKFKKRYVLAWRHCYRFVAWGPCVFVNSDFFECFFLFFGLGEVRWRKFQNHTLGPFFFSREGYFVLYLDVQSYCQIVTEWFHYHSPFRWWAQGEVEIRNVQTLEKKPQEGHTHTHTDPVNTSKLRRKFDGLRFNADMMKEVTLKNNRRCR